MSVNADRVGMIFDKYQFDFLTSQSRGQKPC